MLIATEHLPEPHQTRIETRIVDTTSRLVLDLHMCCAECNLSGRLAQLGHLCMSALSVLAQSLSGSLRTLKLSPETFDLASHDTASGVIMSSLTGPQLSKTSQE